MSRERCPASFQRGIRRRASCGHSLSEQLSQRVYALALGHEDLNDHRELRHDLALQTAINRVETLASPSTLCPGRNAGSISMEKR